jgi:E3 ubiquitin-protein ligase SIAH1
MEDAVNRILLPCKHGCGKNITYYDKEGHEKVCQDGPCFCPNPGCGFRGQTTALFDHFTNQHKWPADHFVYMLSGSSVPGVSVSKFDIPAVPAIRVLRGDDGHLFLLKVASLGSGALKVSLVSVQANTEEPVFRCSFSYEWRSNHSQNVWLDKITNSSLSDGLPEDCSYCVLPNVPGGVTLLLEGICIAPTKNVDVAEEMEWEDDDDDSSFDDYEDDEADDLNDLRAG